MYSIKNLLFLLFGLLLAIDVNAQSSTHKTENIMMEISGGSAWGLDQFDIFIKKQGDTVSVKYVFKDQENIKNIKKDSLYNVLFAQYKTLDAKSEERKKLNTQLLKIIQQHHISLQDSISVPITPFLKIAPLLRQIAEADVKALTGSVPDGFIDADFIICKIIHRGQSKAILKHAPLSLSSPLLYTFMNELFKVGAQAKLRSAMKIDEEFVSLF